MPLEQHENKISPEKNMVHVKGEIFGQIIGHSSNRKRTSKNNSMKHRLFWKKSAGRIIEKI